MANDETEEFRQLVAELSRLRWLLASMGDQNEPREMETAECAIHGHAAMSDSVIRTLEELDGLFARYHNCTPYETPSRFCNHREWTTGQVEIRELSKGLRNDNRELSDSMNRIER